MAGHRVSVTIGDDGHFLYRHQASAPRIPASNEKLLLSMALFDRLGPSLKVPTLVSAEAAPDADGVIDGNLWILGRGDPEVDRATITDLARGVRAAGITQIRGRVKGSTGYFARDWWAVGWKRELPGRRGAVPDRAHVPRQHRPRRRAHLRPRAPGGRGTHVHACAAWASV